MMFIALVLVLISASHRVTASCRCFGSVSAVCADSFKGSYCPHTKHVTIFQPHPSLGMDPGMLSGFPSIERIDVEGTGSACRAIAKASRRAIVACHNSPMLPEWALQRKHYEETSRELNGLLGLMSGSLSSQLQSLNATASFTHKIMKEIKHALGMSI